MSTKQTCAYAKSRNKCKTYSLLCIYSELAKLFFSYKKIQPSLFVKRIGTLAFVINTTRHTGAYFDVIEICPEKAINGQ